MSLYLDASVVVPILIEEASSAAVKRLVAEASETIVVSDLAALEVASALARLVRMGVLSGESAVARLADFDVWRPVVPDGSGIQSHDARAAASFVRRFELGLRAPDALHLAACLRAGHVLVTLDRRLVAAGEALGVKVERPIG